MYDKTIWQNGQTPISEDNLNHIENGIEAAHRGTHIYSEATYINHCYSISFTPAPDNYNIGLIINFKADTDNKGAVVLNVNELGPVPIVKNVNQHLDQGDIKVGQIVNVIYDGENFQIINPLSILASLYKKKGDIVYAAEGQEPRNLPIGSEGQHLVVKSGLPAWKDQRQDTMTKSGEYIGDGTNDRYICIGFTPSFLIISPNNFSGTVGIGISSNYLNFYSNNMSSGLSEHNYLRPSIISNGFVISHKRHRASINKKAVRYAYFAIK